MVIPARDVAFFETLNIPESFEVSIRQRTVAVFVEPVSPDSMYPCTRSDIAHVLTLIPAEFTEQLDFLVFRHPTKKQRLLSPVWGRLVFSADICGRQGNAMFIESQLIKLASRWSKNLGPRDKEELERLRSEGHKIVVGKRDYQVLSTPEAMRNTVLFRTVLHEIGHLHHRTTTPHYASITRDDREAFAERFASKLRSALETDNKIPFPTISDDANNSPFEG